MEIRANDLAQQKWASNWLTSLPLKKENFCPNKREFFDAIATRYRWIIKYLPSTCACSKPFNIDHALSCPKGGFIYQRHNELRDTLANMVQEVCKDVKVEPDLEPITAEQLNAGAIHSDGARSDVSARGYIFIVNKRACRDYLRAHKKVPKKEKLSPSLRYFVLSETLHCAIIKFGNVILS